MSTPVRDPVELAASLPPVAALLVVLDFDGTLSPIVDHPADARLAPGARQVLERLVARTAVALVSGRSVDDLRPRLEGLPVTVAGGHGAELAAADGTVEFLIDVDAVARTLDGVEEHVRSLVDEQPGWLVERKPASLAVHHRLAPPDDVEHLLPRVTAVLDGARNEPPGFAVLGGKAVVELRPSGTDKGAVLDRLADREPGRLPLVVGDDVTDEDAFRAAIARGGIAVLVADAPRTTAATERLADPAAVVAFLSALSDRHREP